MTGALPNQTGRSQSWVESDGRRQTWSPSVYVYLTPKAHPPSPYDPRAAHQTTKTYFHSRRLPLRGRLGQAQPHGARLECGRSGTAARDVDGVLYLLLGKTRWHLWARGSRECSLRSRVTGGVAAPDETVQWGGPKNLAETRARK